MHDNNMANNEFLWSKIKSLLGITIATIGCFFFCLQAFYYFTASFEFSSASTDYTYLAISIGSGLLAIPFFLGAVKFLLNFLGKR
ncbi:hypothetical protein [Photobacterium halotolerans]|uniref:Uncharacterized protein n=1 Tax=Photobacterium halotolerans TaxID=265726 RepID=A0A7X4Y1D5_9GAMM|nr:hypothetical protein [Photobacterium halotolerans]NAW65510.1 hypothetical protein [Photobacterium halotolerans]NAW87323.1 hypothetical protein [Photobacterium halotolerans]NAX48895.1 hypothetical protein [Photobacterium halotolerans]